MKIVSYKEPKLRNPYLISGLPGIGYVAKLSTDYLKEQLNAELFEEVYSPSFPPYVLVKKDGTVELLKNEFYSWSNKESENDLVIFTGNVQAVTPEGQFEVVEEVLQRAEKFSVPKIFSLAAYVGREYVDVPKVYGVVTDVELAEEIKKFGVTLMDEGSISGMNGLLLGYAKLRGIQGICLLGETPNYTTQSGEVFVDAKAAKAVIEVLTRILNVKVDMAPLDKQAKLTEDFFHRVEEISSRAVEEMRRAEERKIPNYYV